MGKSDSRRRAQSTDDNDLFCKRFPGPAVSILLYTRPPFSNHNCHLRLDEIERSVQMYPGVRRMYDRGCMPLLLLITVHPCGMLTNES
jgi:hypothetical protein